MTMPDPESALSRYFESYVAAGKPGGARFSARHPRATVRALRDLHALPAVPFAVAPAGEGPLVRRAVLDRPGWAALRPAVSTLAIPSDPEAYLAGSSKQTVRRKSRAAVRAGVTWRRVDDGDERVALLARADAYERAEARTAYRNAGADNTELLGVRQWLGAFAADGEPLMLSITPVADGWGALAYFRTFSADPAASDARYLMTGLLVEHLAAQGFTRLADTVHPAHLQNGLRHFQRMVGFRLERVVPQPVPQPRSAPTPTTVPEALRP